MADKWWYEVVKNHDDTYSMIETNDEDLRCTTSFDRFYTIDGLEQDILSMLDAIRKYKQTNKLSNKGVRK